MPFTHIFCLVIQAVQGIGWWLAEHNIAQLSLNLTDMDLTPMHLAFEEVQCGACNKPYKNG